MASRTADEKLGIEEALDQLYAQPPGEFTQLRNALARQLAGSGAAGDAAALRALSRPSLPAWALNQAVRKEPERAQQLLDAGKALRQAQRRVLSGVKEHGLNDAVSRRREAIRALGKVAAKVLEQAGKNAGPYRNDIDATLQSASIDAEAGELLRKGRLTRALPPPAGFGELGGLTLVPQAKGAPAVRAEPGEKVARAADRQRLESARTRARQAAEHASSASRRATELRSKAESAAEEAERLRRDAERALKFAAQLAQQAEAAEQESLRAKEASERRTGVLQRLEKRLR